MHRSLLEAVHAVLHRDVGNARLRLQAAAALIREGGGAASWEMNMIQEFMCQELYWSGSFRDLAERLNATLAEARARGNRHLERNLSLRFGHVPALVADDPEAGARIHAEARAGWWPARFSTLDHFSLLTVADLHLYAEGGRGAAALRHVEGQWEHLSRSRILGVERMAVYPLNVRARAALAAAAAGVDREGALSIAARATRRLTRMEIPLAQALGALSWAGLAAGAGDDVEAMARFARAEEALAAIGCAHYAAAARRRRGALLNGDEGAALVAGADATLRAEGARDPARLAAMLAPG